VKPRIEPRWGLAWAGLFGVCAWLAAPGVGAQPDAEGPQKAAALALFQEGRQLMGSGDTARACAKLAESHRLDPGGGTLLNLALCHERQRRTATAWAEFQDALRMARLDRRSDRVAFAETHLADLEPRVPRVEIVVETTGAEGLHLSLNGVAIREAAWGAMIPVDPGKVLVEARAAGKQPWRTERSIADGDLITIVVPELRDAPAPRREAPHRRRSPEPVAVRRSAWALPVAAGGVAALGVSGAFAWFALNRRGASDAECPGGRCSRAGVAYNEQAQTLADVATGAAAVGLAGVALGAWLYWSGGAERPGAVQVGVAPGRLQLGSRF
jgi:hypothetical protein